jgi:hypothetical protein
MRAGLQLWWLSTARSKTGHDVGSVGMRRRRTDRAAFGVTRLAILSSAGSCQGILLLDCSAKFCDSGVARVKRTTIGSGGGKRNGRDKRGRV